MTRSNFKGFPRICIPFLLAFACLAGTKAPAAPAAASSRWEAEIAAFEKRDLTIPPPKGAILFVGSSSIRKWTRLSESFPGFTVINRGFGGSEIADSTFFADRIIFPYEPRMVVLYAGDNDLAAGKSADRVVGDYKQFVEKVHDRLPHAKIAFISIKPCPARWRLRDKVQEVNRRILEMKKPWLAFIDIYPSMLDSDGQPRKDLFLADGLHPNDKCYELWASLIKPYLK